MTNTLYQAAKRNLSSTDTIKRFQGATYFAQNIHTDMKRELETCRRNEKVRYIKMALDKALHLLSNTTPTPPLSGREEPEDVLDNSEELRRHLKNQAIDEFSGVILHELAPKLGLLDASLKEEFSEYDTSKAKGFVERLTQIFSAIECLRKSTHKPESVETDLSQLIKNIIHDEIIEKEKIDISLQGLHPCIIHSDPALLTLALSNAIRNSYESISLLPSNEPKKLIISWGVNDKDSWICVMDNGGGFIGNPEVAFKLGKTSKQGHAGFGLGIMKQVMDNIGGYAELSNIETGGAKLLLRWGNF